MAAEAQILNPLTFPLRGERLIEASAGTGKTYTITALYLRLLLGHSAEGGLGKAPLSVEQILVVTFTEAATQELRERIRSRIHTAKQGFLRGASADPFVQELIDHWREQAIADEDRQLPVRLLDQAEKLMDEAAIFTIHGFCQRMLRQNAFESGSLFETELITDDQDLLHQAASDFWRQHFYPLPTALVAELRRIWPSPEALLRQVRPFLNTQDLLLLPALEDLDLQQLYARRVDELDSFKAQWRQAEADLPALIRDSGVSKQSYSSRYLPRWLEEMSVFAASPTEGLALPDSLARFSQAVLIEKTKKGEPPRHAVFDACDALIAPRPGLREVALASALKEIGARMRISKALQQQLSFDDLLGHLDKALASASGARLAARIREQYPLAMIDEFQDTDPLQYRIFSRLYGDQDACGLFMIGDPKQAIYAFRGADIYTYLQARQRVTSHFNLSTNWRSSSTMIDAVNGLFSRSPLPFLECDIPYHPVAPGGKADKTPLKIDGALHPALVCWHEAGDGEPVNRERYLRVMAEATATRINQLLTLGDAGRACIGERSLAAGDIAVLVRTGAEGALIQEALAAQNVPSVYLSNRDSVFETTVAGELYRLLAACNAPTEESLVRAALATSLFGLDAAALDGLNQEEDRWEAAVSEFSDYQDCWRERGVLPMLHQILARREIAERLLCERAGERRLTDLLHLGELLQTASLELEGEHGLLRWLAEHIADPNGQAEEQQMRLESDQRLVQIVTIHKSKGLEYEVVFLPFPCVYRPASEALYHDPVSRRPCLNLLADAEAVALADRERLAEDLRLLYVALTRSVHACYLGMAPLKLGRGKGADCDLHRSAIGYLLLGEEPQPPSALGSALGALASEWPSFELTAPPAAAEVGYSPPPVANAELRARTFAGVINRAWQITSYSALSQHRPSPLELSLGRLDWEADDVQATAAAEPADGDIFAFPRGARAGTFLHELFEALDFPHASGAGLLEVIAARLQRDGFDTQWQPTLAQLVADVLDAPLDVESGLKLRDIPQSSKLVEMEFHLPLARLDGPALSDLVRRHDPLFAQAPALTFAEVRGLLKGFIDLVFEYQGRYYVLDYKSNHLGGQLEDYSQEALQAAMLEHRYDLQYQLYALALHRYLRSRKPDYDYEQHFGGVYYLFLRGMRADQGAGSGVFYHRPSLSLLQAMDRLFDGEGPN